MAKAQLDPALGALSGKIGNFVYRQSCGRQIVSELPDFRGRVPSEKQVAQISRFSTGNLKWKALSAEIKALYTARARELQMPPCALYQKNNSRPPTVEQIDVSQYTGQAGQTIRIVAVDLVDVTEVQVIIRLAGGAQLEAGAATRPGSGQAWWVYQTTAAASATAGLTVEAIAANWPAKTASRMAMLGG